MVSTSSLVLLGVNERSFSMKYYSFAYVTLIDPVSVP
jgi:hypothetical protein